MLFRQAAAALQTSEPLLDEPFAQLLRQNTVCVEHLGSEQRVFLPRLSSAERAIAARVSAMAKALPWWGSLTASAQAALIGKAQQALITGGPGCGKTTTTEGLISALNGLGARVALAAPTGRAAKWMSEITGAEAKTIHRLIGAGRRQHTEIAADVVLIDEASMVDTELLCRLIKATPERAVLILVGDADQLPSVAAGRVFADLLQSGLAPAATLREVHRQAEGSAIVRATHAILAGQVPQLQRTGDCVGWQVATPAQAAATIKHLVARVIPERHGLDPRTEVQVPTPMRKGIVGTIELNRRLQARLTPRLAEGIGCGEQRFAPGDRVLVTRTDYERDMFNGDIGLIRHADLAAARLVVLFDGRAVKYPRQDVKNLLLGYAVTVRKSQGAEYPGVVLVAAREHFPLLSRQLPYAGLTRARQAVHVVSQEGALGFGITRQGQTSCTGLVHRLRGEGALASKTPWRARHRANPGRFDGSRRRQIGSPTTRQRN